MPCRDRAPLVADRRGARPAAPRHDSPRSPRALPDADAILSRMKRICCSMAAMLALASAASHGQSGRLLVLNKEDATLVIVNPDSGAVVGKVPVGQGPHELAASDDGKYAFASNYGSGPAAGHTISMIDLAARKELRRIDV